MNASMLRLGRRDRPVELLYYPIFACFFISGFCSLLYQVIWTRLAFAHFGIITPVVSSVISVFMLGLGVGSFYGGRLATVAQRRFQLSPLYLYAAAEALIALGAFTVPVAFNWSGTLLLRVGAASSAEFLFLSAGGIIVTLFPWCTAMGMTIPLMMSFARGNGKRAGQSFSFLYAASVLGAAAGAATTALVLVELFGLQVTCAIGAVGNLSIAAIAAILAACVPYRAQGAVDLRPAVASPQQVPRWVGALLFITGFSSVGMEVCWARDFTFELLTTIYAFAAILATYLSATFIGSRIYRGLLARDAAISLPALTAWLFPLSLLPVVLADPRTDHSAVQTLSSIVPFCGLLGFVTPGLIDRFAQGDATNAGRLYALNIAGGIVGPLAAGYLLLPALGIRWTIIVLALPLLAGALYTGRRNMRSQIVALAASVSLAAIAIGLSRAHDDGSIYPPNVIHRDFAGSAVAWRSGRSAQLFVNAIPITSLTTDTKEMAYLPMALHRHPRTALDICFGMGTTFRSLSAWGVDTTAVDLSPAVLASFNVFYSDAATILANPHNHIIADDGRRYLQRTSRRFDVITLDPPPPAEAAGSSLLYSLTFYEVVKRRLAPGGIVAQWLPRTESRLSQSVALALRRSFPYVLVFTAVHGSHFIASLTPLTIPDTAGFIQRMPVAARQDAIEWENGADARSVVGDLLRRQVPFASLLPAGGFTVPALSDDRPYNEYFFLRRSGLID